MGSEVAYLNHKRMNSMKCVFTIQLSHNDCVVRSFPHCQMQTMHNNGFNMLNIMQHVNKSCQVRNQHQAVH